MVINHLLNGMILQVGGGGGGGDGHLFEKSGDNGDWGWVFAGPVSGLFLCESQ